MSSNPSGTPYQIRTFNCIEGPTNEEAWKIMVSHHDSIGGTRSEPRKPPQKLRYKLHEGATSITFVVIANICGYTMGTAHLVNAELAPECIANRSLAGFTCPSEIIVYFDDQGKAISAQDWSTMPKPRRPW